MPSTKSVKITNYGTYFVNLEWKTYLVALS